MAKSERDRKKDWSLRTYGKQGEKKEKAVETPLYVKCPQCSEKGLPVEGCLCQGGYVVTGFTQERFDRLIKDNDKLLILLDMIADSESPISLGQIADEVQRRKADIEAAKSRTVRK